MFNDDQDKQPQGIDPRDGIIEDLRMQVRRLEDRLAQSQTSEVELRARIAGIQEHEVTMRSDLEARAREAETKLEAVRSVLGTDKSMEMRITRLEEDIRSRPQQEDGYVSFGIFDRKSF